MRAPIHHRALPAELSTEEICGILEQIASLGVMTVTFTGGETDGQADLLQILDHTQRRGLLINFSPTRPDSHLGSSIASSASP
ncbi:MAG: hypothetical protein U0361_05840 [Nitrospiraceae bacterium]